ncbi:type II toxin-antitoxin system RelE family toxin [Methanobrevibacter cuticularis]|uniref:type II toxin-antitoxin system RelE family toxin n=1 Tax=Methanobrevibacter cuticularis TaxID=47311 RepID=UPI0008369270|nr:type II toxin-antitoxin system RelE/ParE family toxin [Methanobrevibacter cuticularis]
MKKNSDYNLVIKPSAKRYLIKLSKKNKKDSKLLLKSIKKIPNNPYNSISLKSRVNKERRVRTGDYRIIFKIIEDENPSVIEIIRIGKRASIYKK